MFIHFWNLRESARALFVAEKATPMQSRPLMDELRGFCRADVSCVIVAKDGRIDTHATAVAEGRREVFLKIQQLLSLTDEQLHKLEVNDDD
jgi:hypothetical protein